MLEVILRTNSKCDAISKVLGHLQEAVSPVVRSLGILYIVYSVVCYNDSTMIVEVLYIIRERNEKGRERKD
jgi:hypothetical protein